MALPPMLLIRPTISVLIRPVSTISTTWTSSFARDALAVGELRLSSQLLQRLGDLGAAAVDDDGLEAGGLQQHHLLGEAALQLWIHHRRAAVLDDGALAAELADVAQRLDDQRPVRADRRALDAHPPRARTGVILGVDLHVVEGQVAAERARRFLATPRSSRTEISAFFMRAPSTFASKATGPPLP